MFDWARLVAAVKACVPVFVILTGIFGIFGVIDLSFRKDRPALLWWDLPILFVEAVTIAWLLIP